MYLDSGYKRAHMHQALLPHREGPGDEARNGMYNIQICIILYLLFPEYKKTILGCHTNQFTSQNKLTTKKYHPS